MQAKNKQDTIKERLISLGAEHLAEVLTELASRNEDAARTIGRLTSAPADNIAQFSAKLSAIRRSRRFIEYRESATLAHDLTDLLEDLKTGISDPRTGLEILTSFFECDRSIFERSDDSDGIIGDVFRFDARDLFVEFASNCPDKEWLCDVIVNLIKTDEYGVRDCIIDACHAFLSKEYMQKLASHFDRLSKKNSPTSFGARKWLYGIESLAKQMGDALLFEKTRLRSWPGASASTCLDIAQVYLDTGDAKNALTWIENVQDIKDFEINKRDKLLFSIYEKLGNKAAMADAAWSIFKHHRSKDTLNVLLSAIGESKRNHVIREQKEIILGSGKLVLRNADFFIEIGLSDEASSYILKNAEQLNGDFYGSVLPLAEAMEKNNHYLAASMIYRALVESILRRAISKYYYHAVRYLKKLDVLASKITDWQRFSSHSNYKNDLFKAHARKYALWSKYKI